jgi:hypothetical protein
MPQGLIVTEAGLMYQCLSPRRISKRGAVPNAEGSLLQRLPLLHQRSRNTPRLSRFPGTEVKTFTLITVRLLNPVSTRIGRSCEMSVG